jgi:hypothetical protein
MKHWGYRVILNVDLPISAGWQRLLIGHGYAIQSVFPAYTRRYGGLDNADKRAEHEVVIEARRYLAEATSVLTKPRRLIRRPVTKS